MYRAPVRDLTFVVNELIGARSLEGCPKYADYSADVAVAIIEEAGKFAEEVLAPLYRTGDTQGARWTPEGVVTTPGFKAAYRAFADAGWNQLTGDPGFGGQGMPRMLATAVQELWAGSNLAFKLCPMLTQGAIEALELNGSEAQKQMFLPKMVSGEWTGTMVLTEPQAGSDLGQIRTRAVPAGDHYRLFGQKIFITWGEHDFTSNIVHMVLARIDGAPPGTRGISLFIVPKFLVNADGSIGARNEVQCLSIEHKLGIHASPTCVMQYGAKEGAIGYLVGEENRGLEYMFIMMNAARLSVGLEGYSVAGRAYQQALEWARTRVQGRPPVAAPEGPAPIVHYPDIKRMLLTMRANTEAARSLAIYAASQLDIAATHGDEKLRAAAQARGDLLIPVVKAWSTETGIESASLGLQVHGGMGFIEETGAAQLYRDVRITTIYEGTTGIQANDLLGRKLARDRGAAMAALLADVAHDLEAITSEDPSVQAARHGALEGVAELAQVTKSLLGALGGAHERALAVAVPYLKLTGIVLGGWLHAKAAAIAAARLAAGGDSDPDFYRAKLATARFYAEHLLPNAEALARVVQGGGAAVAEVDAALL
ncbi:MAG: 3-methylmercaptopropionyl-CoA dehydrogenase [Steroidobacteraceae bacterium]|nr:3-methylmercaptopropionyl-CoA dehydrogenase [Steroidobacteraceae bacterium]